LANAAFAFSKVSAIPDLAAESVGSTVEHAELHSSGVLNGESARVG
jgi:hypothetical protein